jgi:acyl-CoA synthetase (AMP-forming)/AMP-acid ligase II
MQAARWSPPWSRRRSCELAPSRCSAARETRARLAQKGGDAGAEILGARRRDKGRPLGLELFGERVLPGAVQQAADRTEGFRGTGCKLLGQFKRPCLDGVRVTQFADEAEISRRFGGQRYHDTAQRIAGAVPLADIARLGRDGTTDSVARPEDGLLIIYTSGTTGLPKAAVISHRAEIARMCALRLDLGISQQDGYIAWPPMFHMGGTEHTLATLMSGGVGVAIDGFDPDAIVDALSAHRIGWLLLVPATIGPLLDRLRARRIGIKGVRAVGCMADLVPAAEIVAITEALDAPFLNTFGATETGMPPLSAGLIPVGTAPDSFAKTLSILADLRLADEAGQDVPDGATGEAWMRGPTLFSGYWNAPEANASSFRDGWFRMGDLFRKEADGYHFAGRSKYLIKSGGENIYPAEIERILLSDPRVLEAVVVRRPDAKWGEIPVAVVARNDDSFDAETVDQLCRASLAGYKRPRETIFLAFEDFPRNATGKVLREAIEQMI